jgi:hypothetical protein
MRYLPAMLLVGLVVSLSAQAPASSTLGPRVGTLAPPFSGVDQFGRTRTLQSLLDRDGVMLVFFRSADW